MVVLKTRDEIAVMREAGRRLARVLVALLGEVRAGIPTSFFDTRSRELIREAGAKPAFLGYRPSGARRGFPAAICVSVNDEIVHGIPGAYLFKEGDIVKLDIGLVYKGLYADSAVTVPVGEVSDEARELIAITEEALRRGVSHAKAGSTLGDIGWAIEDYVRSRRLFVADSLTGHGIGRKLHEDPWVPNRGKAGEGEELREGMVLAIEPMVNIGTSRVVQRKDDSFATADGSLSAHFEHTVAITEHGPEILTMFKQS